MIDNKQENNPNSMKIKISYNNEINEIIVNLKINTAQLKEIIFTKFNLDNSYILTYKNQKITKNDSQALSILFKNDANPLLFINDKNTILPSIKPNSSITLNTNMDQKKLLNIINLFFQSKYLPLNASIKSPMKGVYNIKFSKPNLASDFLNYYNKRMYKSINMNKNKYLTLENNKTNNNLIRIPNICSVNKKLPVIKKKIKIKNVSSTSDIVIKNDKYLALYKVVKEISKSDKISQECISSGINKFHPSYINTISQTKNTKNLKKSYEYINDKYIDETYEGAYNFPFMSQEEKYIKEKFLDKKNWLNQKGFLVSVGKYKMKDNFIPNYVNATPSESPLIHKFREVKKKKWINRNGFIV